MDDQFLPRLLFSGIWIGGALRFLAPALVQRDVSPRAKVCVAALLGAICTVVLLAAVHIHWVPARDGYGVP